MTKAKPRRKSAAKSAPPTSAEDLGELLRKLSEPIRFNDNLDKNIEKLRRAL